MNTKDRLELLQKQIEETTDHMTKSNLFLKKIELLKLKETNGELNYGEIIDQLELDIKREMKKNRGE